MPEAVLTGLVRDTEYTSAGPCQARARSSIQTISRRSISILYPDGSQQVVSMDSLTIFGLFAVTAMLVFYALEERNTFYILWFAGACALGSIYGFLQGAWPFGIVEAIWAAVAARRWWSKRRAE